MFNDRCTLLHISWDSEIILKIGQHLTKLRVEYFGLLFWSTLYIQTGIMSCKYAFLVSLFTTAQVLNITSCERNLLLLLLLQLMIGNAEYHCSCVQYMVPDYTELNKLLIQKFTADEDNMWMKENRLDKEDKL